MACIMSLVHLKVDLRINSPYRSSRVFMHRLDSYTVFDNLGNIENG